MIRKLASLVATGVGIFVVIMGIVALQVWLSDRSPDPERVMKDRADKTRQVVVLLKNIDKEPSASEARQKLTTLTEELEKMPRAAVRLNSRINRSSESEQKRFSELFAVYMAATVEVNHVRQDPSRATAFPAELLDRVGAAIKP